MQMNSFTEEFARRTGSSHPLGR